MAEMKIIQQKIERIEEHQNADRLEIAFTDVYDWPIIVSKDSFKIGDKVIHFPVDCVIPPELEDILLGDSKIKLSKGRVRAAKIRGIVSYGILAPLNKLQRIFSIPDNTDDLMVILDCKKYEPPVKPLYSKSNVQQKSWKVQNTNFTKYFNMNHLQNCKGIFNPDNYVIVTEKLHGTSFRAGWVKKDTKTLLDKIKFYIKKLFNKDAEWEFVYGSRNVQLQSKPNRKTGFYEKDVYTKMVNKYKLKDKLDKGIVIYAEIVGPGIQKNYQYTEDHEMFIYDIKNTNINDSYLGPRHTFGFCHSVNLSPVPVLGGVIGVKDSCIKFKDLNLEEYFKKGSVFNIGKFPMEGIVIETYNNEICNLGRKKVKVINSEYLLNKTNTDFH